MSGTEAILSPERVAAIAVSVDDEGVSELADSYEALRAKADCGGTNCGKCQQCLTVNLWASEQAVEALRAERDRYRDGLGRIELNHGPSWHLREIARDVLAAADTPEAT